MIMSCVSGFPVAFFVHMSKRETSSRQAYASGHTAVITSGSQGARSSHYMELMSFDAHPPVCTHQRVVHVLQVA
jgi:hypothetical protein